MSSEAHVDFSITHAVPGLGEWPDYVPVKGDPLYVGDPLPTVLLEENYTSGSVGGAFLPILTSREFRMLSWMNEVTDKPDWFKKVFDSKIIAKWRAETVAKEEEDMKPDGDGAENDDAVKGNKGDDKGREGPDAILPSQGAAQEEKARRETSEEGGSNKEGESDSDEKEEVGMTVLMFDYCVAELQHLAEHVYPKKNDGAIIVFNGNVVKADNAVAESTKLALQTAVKPLELVPERNKDWHPDSDDKVLDLVHPSLFPLIYGKSRVLKVGERVVGLDDCIDRCGEGAVLPARPVPGPRIELVGPYFPDPYSDFQWLPCEVDISGNEGAKIISYINNLHPKKHADLYRVIEKVIDASIPLWELTLAPLYDKEFNYFKRIACDTVYYMTDEQEETGDAESESEGSEGADGGSESEEEVDNAEGSNDGGTGPEGDEKKGSDVEVGGEAEGDNGDSEEDGSYEAETTSDNGGSEGGDGNQPEDEGDDDEEEEEPGPRILVPEPEPFDAKNTKSPKPVNFKELYGKNKRPLQIIVKLANIELTPEKPKYEGGAWHVEGKQNEHICATAIYYYTSHNIQDSHLAFSQFVDTEPITGFPYEQDRHEFLQVLFGCANEEMGEQYAGKVKTREGRLITFPNILLHQVQPFELEDPLQKGHRKILALFLVDPNVRIVSTANVPCQQLDWWREAMISGPGGGVPKGLDRLPVELKDKVFESVDGFPITLKEAKELRVELMEERKKFAVDYKRSVADMNSFSLCEH